MNIETALIILYVLFVLYVVHSSILVKKKGIEHYELLFESRNYLYTINREFKLLKIRSLKADNPIKEIDKIIKEIKDCQKDEKIVMKDMIIISFLRFLYGTKELASYYGNAKFDIYIYDIILTKVYSFKEELNANNELEEA